MSKFDKTTGEYNIAGLAEASGISIRNIRAYRARNLLQAPERRGRSSVYTQAHLTRLRTIARMLSRGYTMANIEELLQAWQAGQDIAGVLGLATEEPGQAAPRTWSLKELRKLFGPAVTPAIIDRVVAGGYAERRGAALYIPRPTLLHVSAELTKMGVPLADLLDILEQLTRQLGVATRAVVDTLDTPGDASGDPGRPLVELAEVASKLRTLLDRAIASEVGHALEQALDERFGASPAAGQERARSTA